MDSGNCLPEPINFLLCGANIGPFYSICNKFAIFFLLLVYFIL